MSKKYKKIDPLNQVADFHLLFKHPILDTPAIPDESRTSLRIKLLQEELDELKEAVENNNIVEVADALCDLQYVLSGAVLEFGLADKFPDLFNEVQASNMSKVCLGKKAELDTLEFYRDKGVDAYSEYIDQFTTEGYKGSAYLIYRKEDNKVLKSINYFPADLKSIIGHDTTFDKEIVEKSHKLENLTDIANYAKTQAEFFEKGFLVYKRDNTTNRCIIIFNKFETMPSGFIKPLDYLCFGKEPIGLSDNNFIINPSLLEIIHPNQKALFREFLISNDRSVRYYFEDKEYDANDGLSPDRIIGSDYLGDLVTLELTHNHNN